MREIYWKKLVAAMLSNGTVRIVFVPHDGRRRKTKPSSIVKKSHQLRKKPQQKRNRQAPFGVTPVGPPGYGPEVEKQQQILLHTCES